MILRVDTADPMPAYEQIRLQITAMVAAGTLRAGARLPTIRQLASDLGLAKGTVSRAYEMLEREQVVETRGRMGTVVSPRSLDRTAAKELVGDAAERMAVAARQVGMSREEALAALDAALARLG
ncbi:MAG TPA: GntR family transcriptional regulator [Acidimicrobiales bacterium]|nr:GntR family transcriptional regulator [Acidimicrobiales bacterium]